jgi:hypothetical protein
MGNGSGEVMNEERRKGDASLGIVVTDRPSEVAGDDNRPRIAAFIWGGKVRPAPTLPYGRWKGAA